MDNNDSLTNISQAVQTIKTAILLSQKRTTQNVNSDLLVLNFSIGGFISENTRKQSWGNNAIKQISDQLKKELPGLKGFSERNLRNMRMFYEEWGCALFLQPSAAKFNTPAISMLQPTSLIGFHPNIFDVNLAHDFLSISFTHHIEILTQVKTLEERLFYIHQTAVYKWDKYYLRDTIKQDLFHHQSMMPNNFLLTMPKRVQALKAIEMFKDEYLLDYINVEELGVRDETEIDEKVIETTIIQNVKNFIMTFGKDFTFVGNQYHLEKFNKDHFIDLLFYNRELSCLVAVELKKGEFKAIYLAQLQTYLQILDDDIRKPQENPSIGIILCQDADKAYVEYVIQRYESPMGVATYKTATDMPERLRKALPDIEDLRKIISRSNEIL